MQEPCGAVPTADDGTAVQECQVTGATRCRMHGARAGRKPTHGRYTKRQLPSAEVRALLSYCAN